MKHFAQGKYSLCFENAGTIYCKKKMQLVSRFPKHTTKLIVKKDDLFD